MCCCKKRLRKALSGEYEPWNRLEDSMLRNSGKDSIEIKNLVEKRGQEDVDRRIKFLSEDD